MVDEYEKEEIQSGEEELPSGEEGDNDLHSILGEEYEDEELQSGTEEDENEELQHSRQGEGEEGGVMLGRVYATL